MKLGDLRDVTHPTVDVRVEVDGGEGDDRIYGGPLDDILLGGPGHDALSGAAGNDTEMGGPGDDWFDGQDTDTGDDLYDGGAGRDQFWGTPGRNTIVGGEGDDQIDYSTVKGPVTLDLRSRVATLPDAQETFGEDLERAYLSNYADHVEGGVAAVAVNGGGGSDVMNGGEGRDVFSGGYGDDQIVGNGGDDDLTDEIFGTQGGRDMIDGGSGNDRVFGGMESDSLLGGPGDDVVDARDDFKDSPDCGDGNDTLYAEPDDNSGMGCEVTIRSRFDPWQGVAPPPPGSGSPSEQRTSAPPPPPGVKPSARVRHKSARLRLSCPRAAWEGCRGMIRITAGGMGSRSGLGTRFLLRPGAVGTVSVPLPARAVRALGRRRSVRVTAVLSVTGSPEPLRRTVTLTR
jgi:Ca2+-binding RTX toxin-like protein